MRFTITMDSALDVPEELIEKYGIKMIPVMFEINGELVEDGTITPEELVDHFYKNKKYIIRTTPATVEEYCCVFTPLAYMGRQVIHLSASSAMSKGYENAKAAAESFDNVYVVDTKNITVGVSPFIMKIAEMQEQGKSVAEIAEYLENDFSKKVHLSTLMNTLDFIYVGEGSSNFKNTVTQFLMNLFKKKIAAMLDFNVRSDSLHLYKKFDGNYEQAVTAYISDIVSNMQQEDKRAAFLAYTARTSDELVEKCRKQFQTEGKFDEVPIVEASCGITSHFGWGSIILCWYEK